ncbi:Uncharacterised protein [Salmonella enterica subsp. enterica serovar Typhimurium str. DT104]|nr:Uncharacterised protein [Salmonella enterica subsp. enterica serovar Typhimurium str. DT104]
MHRRQQRAQRDNKEHHLIQTLERHFPAQTFKQGRRKLQRHHADVDGHTDRRLKQYRVHVEVTWNVEVRQVPVTTDVDSDRQAAQRVTKQACQQRRAHQRMVLPTVKDIHRPCQRPTAAGKAGADQQVKGNPDAPRETAVQVGNGAQPEDQTLHDKEHTQDD